MHRGRVCNMTNRCVANGVFSVAICMMNMLRCLFQIYFHVTHKRGTIRILTHAAINFNMRECEANGNASSKEGGCTLLWLLISILPASRRSEESPDLSACECNIPVPYKKQTSVREVLMLQSYHVCKRIRQDQTSFAKRCRPRCTKQ